MGEGAGAGAAVVEKIPNYLVQSIIVTICCCVPAGIVAIVFAAQVNGRIAMGDVATARRYSRLAYIWSWVGFGVGLLGVLIYAGLALLGTVFGQR